MYKELVLLLQRIAVSSQLRTKDGVLWPGILLAFGSLGTVQDSLRSTEIQEERSGIDCSAKGGSELLRPGSSAGRCQQSACDPPAPRLLDRLNIELDPGVVVYTSPAVVVEQLMLDLQ